MKQQKYRIGCVGAGYFARFHVNAWERIDEADLVALCDMDHSKAELLRGHRSWVDIYSDVEEMLSTGQLDILDIITPPETHRDLILLAMKYDVHIICQKPLSPSLAESKEIAELIEGYHKQVIVHENFRWMPWYRELSQLVEDDMIGAPHYIYHRMRTGDGWSADAYLDRQPYFRNMPRLLIHETGIHFIDVFRSIMGEITEVYAKIDSLNPALAGEDRALVQFEFASGARGVYDACRFNESDTEDPRYTFGQTLIDGREGSLRLNGEAEIWMQQLGGPSSKILYHLEDVSFGGDCVRHQQQHIISSLHRGVQPVNTVADYLRNIIIEEAIYESATTHQPVRTDN